VDIAGPVKKSRNGRRRAWVLGAVHVLVLLHVTHWLVTGRTVSPVEPSESMRTLELGELNAGFVFFLLAIATTAIFGRFFCGWGCHVVALQDLCGWMMKKAGIRPRPFRSRLLPFAPLVLALYMFVWPTFDREVVRRLLPAAPTNAAGFPGWSDHLTTTDFWATFPGWAVAVPFLLLCGFGVVYLLGAKGFCTYGCPYGAFFGMADAVAPGRIRVSDACNQCGHCTSVCTSNVRVHEEVRTHGMVVDPGCMKCLDCVDTCPNDALSWGFGAPALGRKPRQEPKPKRFDLTGVEEVAAGALFLATFLAWRSVYDVVPLLLAMGIAASVTGLGWLLLGLLRKRVVRLQGAWLKRDGRVTPAGTICGALAALALLLTIQSGGVQAARRLADREDRAVTVSHAQAFALSPLPLAEPMRRSAERAAALYARADRIDQGGLGLLATPEVTLRRTWLAVVLGHYGEALHHLDRVRAEGDAVPRLARDRIRLLRLAGRDEQAIARLQEAIAESPADASLHRELADVRAARGEAEAAVRELVIVVNLEPADTGSRERLVRLLEELGRPDDAARYRNREPPRNR
jgi:ferredoxin